MSDGDWPNDIVFLAAIRNQMEGGEEPAESAQGYRQYPKDPRWLTVVTWLAFLFTALSLIVILYTSNR